MEINSDTTIKELRDAGLISTHTYNCLRYADFIKMEDVLRFATSSEKLLELRNFGRKALSEMVPLLKKSRNEQYISSTHSSALLRLFEKEDENVRLILKDAYEALVAGNDKITQLFKEHYPSVEVLHDVVMEGINGMLQIQSELSMSENVEFRKKFVCFMEQSVSKMSETQCKGTTTYSAYQKKLAELEAVLEVFSYEEKVKYFMNPDARNYFSKLYDSRQSQLNVRTRNFLARFAPCFEDLVPYFERQLNGYYQMCPGQHQRRTITYIYEFNQRLKEEFDQYWQLDSSEAQMKTLKMNYPYLISIERRFVMEFMRENGCEPLFFLLYHYMRLSEKKSDNIFSLRYGIFDGTERTLDELAEVTNLSRERVRQIVARKLEVHDTALFTMNKWNQYDRLLSLPYIIEETIEYQNVKQSEHLNFTFRVFAWLVTLLGERGIEVQVKQNAGSYETKVFSNQYKVETFGDIVVILNCQKMPSFKFRKSLENIQREASLQNARDRVFNISAMFQTMEEEEKNYATKLMAYMSKKTLGLEVNEDLQVTMRKNYTDVGIELYDILESEGQPMSIDELFEAFKQKFPEHKYTCSTQIRPCLTGSQYIKAIGNTSRYGLSSWDNVFYGSIRDLLIKLLDESEEPLHIEKLFEEVHKHYQDTKPRSLIASMTSDEQSRFVRFNDGYFGLCSKQYNNSFEEYNAERQRSTFDERLTNFCNFVETYQRYPTSSNGTEEASLYRWLYNVQNNVYAVNGEDKARLSQALDRYQQERIPRNADENVFRNNCNDYKDYINSHHCLPTVNTEPDLYAWMARSKAKYNSFEDNRREYLTDLFNYIRSLGFSVNI